MLLRSIRQRPRSMQIRRPSPDGNKVDRTLSHRFPMDIFGNLLGHTFLRTNLSHNFIGLFLPPDHNHFTNFFSRLLSYEIITQNFFGLSLFIKYYSTTISTPSSPWNDIRQYLRPLPPCDVVSDKNLGLFLPATYSSTSSRRTAPDLGASYRYSRPYGESSFGIVSRLKVGKWA